MRKRQELLVRRALALRQRRAFVALLGAGRRLAAAARRHGVCAGNPTRVGDRRAAGRAPRMCGCPIAVRREVLQVVGAERLGQRRRERLAAGRRVVDLVAPRRHRRRALLAADETSLGKPQAGAASAWTHIDVRRRQVCPLPFHRIADRAVRRVHAPEVVARRRVRERPVALGGAYHGRGERCSAHRIEGLAPTMHDAPTLNYSTTRP